MLSPAQVRFEVDGEAEQLAPVKIEIEPRVIDEAASPGRPSPGGPSPGELSHRWPLPGGRSQPVTEQLWQKGSATSQQVVESDDFYFAV